MPASCRRRPPLVRNLLLNCGQRDINFADHAAPLELHSRRARELLREAFFDEKHPEASARRLSNERPSLFAPSEMKCGGTLIDFRRNIHVSVGTVSAPCLLAFVHNSLIVITKGSAAAGLIQIGVGWMRNCSRPGVPKGSIAVFNNSGSIAPAQLVRRSRS